MEVGLKSKRCDPTMRAGLIHGPSAFREPSTYSLFYIRPRGRRRLPGVPQEVGSKLEQEVGMVPDRGSGRWVGGAEPSSWACACSQIFDITGLWG